MDLKTEKLNNLMESIRHFAEGEEDPSEFLQELQAMIEEIPGAYVSFATRDLEWLKNGSYLEDRGDPSNEDLQSLIHSASAGYEEGYASEDGISFAMDKKLKEALPTADEKDEPEEPDWP